MKTLVTALMFLLCTFVAYPQTAYAPGGINYGKGMIVKESSGTGAPNPLTCSGYVRYWQTDAAISPMWACLSGTMVNIGGSSTSGGTSFAVTTTATGLQSLSGPLQSPSFAVGRTDTNFWNCGTKCAALGSASGTTDGTLQTQAVNSNAVNGELNAALYTGSDIGAKVNAALATLGTGGGTVHIPPGTYSFSTPIAVGYVGQLIDCDAGANLNFTGTSTAAITLVTVNGTSGSTNTGIDGHGGCHLNGPGTGTTSVGVDFVSTNASYVTGMRIAGFQRGIHIDGANSIRIFNNTLHGNFYGIKHDNGSTASAANAIYIHDNEISGNTWGYYNDHQFGGNAPNNTELHDNVFEENDAGGDLYAGFIASIHIYGNYFESTSPYAIQVGVGGANAFDVHIHDNYFSDFYSTSYIEIGSGFGFFIEHNYNFGTAVMPNSCAVNITGSATNVNAISVFSQNTQAGNFSTNICNNGSPMSSTNGTEKYSGSISIAGSLSANATTLGATTQNGTFTLNTGKALDGGTVIGNIGPISVYATTSNVNGLACPVATAIDVGPWGMCVCESGTWVKK